LNGETDADKLEALIEKIEALKTQIGIKKTIADYGVPEETFLDTLDKMSLDAFDDQCTGANPRYPLVEEIKRMFLNAYYGRKDDV
jgi:acetaldehyde dehydrogenase/alcohol dehydrogenase